MFQYVPREFPPQIKILSGIGAQCCSKGSHFSREKNHQIDHLRLVSNQTVSVIRLEKSKYWALRVGKQVEESKKTFPTKTKVPFNLLNTMVEYRTYSCSCSFPLNCLCRSLFCQQQQFAPHPETLRSRHVSQSEYPFSSLWDPDPRTLKQNYTPPAGRQPIKSFHGESHSPFIGR